MSSKESFEARMRCDQSVIQKVVKVGKQPVKKSSKAMPKSSDSGGREIGQESSGGHGRASGYKGGSKVDGLRAKISADAGGKAGHINSGVSAGKGHAGGAHTGGVSGGRGGARTGGAPGGQGGAGAGGISGGKGGVSGGKGGQGAGH